LWLKDKGDSFFRDKNYVSAIEAYSEAIKLDSRLMKAYLNRSLSYLKIFKLQDAINDCDQCLCLLQSELPNSEEEKVHSRVVLAKVKARKAICLAWRG
jgi:tetratricopeptide (TPR) repeat protein